MYVCINITYAPLYSLYMFFISDQIQQQLADNSGFGLLVQVMATSKVTFSLSCLHKQIYYLGIYANRQ